MIAVAGASERTTRRPSPIRHSRNFGSCAWKCAFDRAARRSEQANERLIKALADVRTHLRTVLVSTCPDEHKVPLRLALEIVNNAIGNSDGWTTSKIPTPAFAMGSAGGRWSRGSKLRREGIGSVGPTGSRRRSRRPDGGNDA